jgi:hypothetical protein
MDDWRVNFTWIPGSVMLDLPMIFGILFRSFNAGAEMDRASNSQCSSVIARHQINLESSWIIVAGQLAGR